MRKQWTESQWQSEVDYILLTALDLPGTEFNYDPETFKGYCTMQEKFCRADGFNSLADDIQYVINHTGA